MCPGGGGGLKKKVPPQIISGIALRSALKILDPDPYLKVRVLNRVENVTLNITLQYQCQLLSHVHTRCVHHSNFQANANVTLTSVILGRKFIHATERKLLDPTLPCSYNACLS